MYRMPSLAALQPRESCEDPYILHVNKGFPVDCRDTYDRHILALRLELEMFCGPSLGGEDGRNEGRWWPGRKMVRTRFDSRQVTNLLCETVPRD